MLMSKTVHGQGGHFTPLQPTKMAAEVGKQAWYPVAGTALKGLGLPWFPRF